jgi:hypothetical protein
MQKTGIMLVSNIHMAWFDLVEGSRYISESIGSNRTKQMLLTESIY